MIRVTISREGEPARQLTLAKDDVIVGRGGEADVQLTSEAVSRRHARLTRTDAGWQVSDLGAANGVYVQSGGGEPERIVIRPLKAGDRIHIESFVIELEERERPSASDPFLAVADDSGEGVGETTLETQRTQFISMVDVLAARDAARGDDRPPTVTGPIMKMVSGEGADLTVTPHGGVQKSAAPASAWSARMTSPSGHERNFALLADSVQVGSGEDCAVRLPTGPSVIVELERAGSEVSFRRVPLWPFPRVVVGGRAEKRGSLADGESFLVGEYEVTVHLAKR